jgi:putative solute:sodium symporter small subunit
MSPGTRTEYWRQTCRLTAGLLVLWFGVTFSVAFFARELSVRFLGWPLSFYLAAQGALLVFLLIVHVYARQQTQRDRAFGVIDAGGGDTRPMH